MKRRPSRRAETDAALIGEIRAAPAASCGTYGAPRIHAELTAKEMRVGRKRVARLMLQAGLAGVSRRKFVVTTVKSDSRQAPDLVKRDFTASVPDRLWVADNHSKKITDLSNPFPILVWVYLIWNGYHFGMQNFGVLSLYQHKPRSARRASDRNVTLPCRHGRCYVRPANARRITVISAAVRGCFLVQPLARRVRPCEPRISSHLGICHSHACGGSPLGSCG